jgi:hypothetical protein
MKTEKTKMITEGQIPRSDEKKGDAIAFGVIGLSEALLLINATATAPEAIIPAAIIVAVGWSIAIAISMWPTY